MRAHHTAGGCITPEDSFFTRKPPARRGLAWAFVLFPGFLCCAGCAAENRSSEGAAPDVTQTGKGLDPSEASARGVATEALVVGEEKRGFGEQATSTSSAKTANEAVKGVGPGDSGQGLGNDTGQLGALCPIAGEEARRRFLAIPPGERAELLPLLKRCESVAEAFRQVEGLPVTGTDPVDVVNKYQAVPVQASYRGAFRDLQSREYPFPLDRSYPWRSSLIRRWSRVLTARVSNSEAAMARFEAAQALDGRHGLSVQELAVGRDKHGQRTIRVDYSVLEFNRDQLQEMKKSFDDDLTGILSIKEPVLRYRMLDLLMPRIGVCQSPSQESGAVAIWWAVVDTLGRSLPLPVDTTGNAGLADQNRNSGASGKAGEEATPAAAEPRWLSTISFQHLGSDALCRPASVRIELEVDNESEGTSARLALEAMPCLNNVKVEVATSDNLRISADVACPLGVESTQADILQGKPDSAQELSGGTLPGDRDMKQAIPEETRGLRMRILTSMFENKPSPRPVDDNKMRAVPTMSEMRAVPTMSDLVAVDLSTRTPEVEVVTNVRFEECIKKEAEGTVLIDRDFLAGEMADPAVSGREPRAVQYFDGESDRYRGFRLLGIRENSFHGALGIKSGDVLLSVNGGEVDNPAEALGFLTELQTKDTIKVEIIRSRAPLTLTFHAKSGVCPKARRSK